MTAGAGLDPMCQDVKELIFGRCWDDGSNSQYESWRSFPRAFHASGDLIYYPSTILSKSRSICEFRIRATYLAPSVRVPRLQPGEIWVWSTLRCLHLEMKFYLVGSMAIIVDIVSQASSMISDDTQAV